VPARRQRRVAPASSAQPVQRAVFFSPVQRLAGFNPHALCRWVTTYVRYIYTSQAAQTGCGQAFSQWLHVATRERRGASWLGAPPAWCGTRARGSGRPRARRPAAGRRPPRARAATARPRPLPHLEALNPAIQRCGCRGPAPPPRLPRQRPHGLSSRLHTSDRRSRQWNGAAAAPGAAAIPGI